MIFGANALLTKPGQSFAPLLGWLVLHSISYRDSRTYPEGASLGLADSVASMHQTMFLMLVCVPFCCAVVQLVLWSRYTLKDTYLKDIKMQRRETTGLV